MKWYSAHLIIYFELKDEPQDHFYLWENIVLIKAETTDEAFEKAKLRGQQDEGDDESLTWNGKPARAVFAGVRKLVECLDPEERPEDGTEVSYVEIEVASKADIERMIAGDPVELKLWE